MEVKGIQCRVSSYQFAGFRKREKCSFFMLSAWKAVTAVQMAATPPVYSVQSVGADKWKIGADRLEWQDRFSNRQAKTRKQQQQQPKKYKKSQATR